MIEVGSVVQLGPNTTNQMFAFCFMVVTEVKPWGAKGYVKNAGEEGLAYYRAKNEDMVLIGKAEWVAE